MYNLHLLMLGVAALNYVKVLVLAVSKGLLGYDTKWPGILVDLQDNTNHPPDTMPLLQRPLSKTSLI
jgi:hypothetical protein